MSKVKILLYCTMGKPYLYHFVSEKRQGDDDWYRSFDRGKGFTMFDKIQKNHLFREGDLYVALVNMLNGFIVAECECDLVEKYEMEFHHDNEVQQSIGIFDEFETEYWGEDCYETIITNEYSNEEIADCKLLKDSCLTFDELGKYVCPKGGINNFYALHLSNVNVFDKPKDLSDYMKKNQSYRLHKYERLYNAPQNMMTIYDNEENEYILVSIRPEWLCKILKGEKTIEVRKSILNSLKEVFNCGK